MRATAWCALLAALVVARALHHREGWSDPKGWEPLQVAEGLTTGHGFAWHQPWRWLFEYEPRPGLFPAAWAEPVYPLVLAFDLREFGPAAAPATIAPRPRAFPDHAGPHPG